METQTINRHFIVIDDDPINNHICYKYIQIVFPGADVKTFTLPQKGLEHVEAEYAEGHTNYTILFLDINMPVLNGWDVIERFTLFPEEIKKQFTIYILSSSVSIDDRRNADACALVSGFLEKPLSIESLEELRRKFMIQ